MVSPHFFCALLTGIMHGKAVFLIISKIIRKEIVSRNRIRFTIIQNTAPHCPRTMYVYRILIPYQWTSPALFSIIKNCNKELALSIIQMRKYIAAND